MCARAFELFMIPFLNNMERMLMILLEFFVIFLDHTVNYLV